MIQQRPTEREKRQLTLEGSNSLLSGIFLRKDHTYRRVPLKEIVLLEACQNYTLIYTVDETFLYSRQLNKIAGRLQESFFMRVHRSYVVNLEAITGFEGNRLFLGEHCIPISKQYREAVFARFDVL